MRIQFLNGGLANQAFQYIFARYYELSHPGEYMYMDDSYFALNTVHNGYELEKVFGIKPHMLSECFDEQVWDHILSERQKGKSVPTILYENEIPFYMLSEVKKHENFNPFEGKVITIPTGEYHPEILELPGDVYYHGYWINKNWFARYQDIFLKEFAFPDIADPVNKGYLENIENSDSVSLHIRRGDYVKLGWAFSGEIYKKIIGQFLEQASGEWKLFVFSDDIAWCKENHKDLGLDAFREVVFIEGNMSGKNYIDLQLMSRCKGMILSNSAFSYLAALLNARKTFWLNPTNLEI